VFIIEVGRSNTTIVLVPTMLGLARQNVRSTLCAKNTGDSSALRKGKFRRNCRLCPLGILRRTSFESHYRRFALWLGQGARYGLEFASNAVRVTAAQLRPSYSSIAYSVCCPVVDQQRRNRIVEPLIDSGFSGRNPALSPGQYMDA